MSNKTNGMPAGKKARHAYRQEMRKQLSGTITKFAGRLLHDLGARDQGGIELTASSAPGEAISTVRGIIASYVWPYPPKLTYSGLRRSNNKMASGSPIDQGVVTITGTVNSGIGTPLSFDIPVEIRHGKLLDPAIMVFGGTPMVISQSAIDTLLQNHSAFYTPPGREQYSPPNGAEHTSIPVQRMERRTPGMFAVHANRDALRNFVRTRGMKGTSFLGNSFDKKAQGGVMRAYAVKVKPGAADDVVALLETRIRQSADVVDPQFGMKIGEMFGEIKIATSPEGMETKDFRYIAPEDMEKLYESLSAPDDTPTLPSVGEGQSYAEWQGAVPLENQSGDKRVRAKQYGIVLITMVLSSKTWELVRRTSGIGQFYGSTEFNRGRPKPISEEEYKAFTSEFVKPKDGASAAPMPTAPSTTATFAIGDKVEIVSPHPMAGKSGLIKSVNAAKGVANIDVEVSARGSSYKFQASIPYGFLQKIQKIQSTKPTMGVDNEQSGLEDDSYEGGNDHEAARTAAHALNRGLPCKVCGKHDFSQIPNGTTLCDNCHDATDTVPQSRDLMNQIPKFEDPFGAPTMEDRATNQYPGRVDVAIPGYAQSPSKEVKKPHHFDAELDKIREAAKTLDRGLV